MRKIIHIDMDSFFASVEQRDFPDYRGKPLVVGHLGPRSVVSAASYEARKFGVHSAMPISIALRKCPHLIVAEHRFEKYKEASHIINEVFNEYTDLVEPLSLDEAFLDVTCPKKGKPSGSLIAIEIKKEIWQRTHLVASAGVSYNKFLAKIASDMDKPDGFYLIKPEDAEEFLEKLDIGLFFGVGKRTKEKMHNMNIFNGYDLKKLSLRDLTKHFGKMGNYFYYVVRGIDDRPVISNRERKSIGAERTFITDIYDIDIVKEKLDSIIDITWKRCENKKKIGRTVTLKIRFSDFSKITRRRTHFKDLTKDDIGTLVNKMLPHDNIKQGGVRLIGVTLSNFESPGNQGSEQCAEQLKIEFDWAGIPSNSHRSYKMRHR